MLGTPGLAACCIRVFSLMELTQLSYKPFSQADKYYFGIAPKHLH